MSRSPDAEERQLALATLDRLTAQWEQAATDAAAESGEKSKPEALKPETQALANFCHVLLNSAGFLFVD